MAMAAYAAIKTAARSKGRAVWFEAMNEFYSAKQTDEHKVKHGIWAAAVTGYAQALMQLSFDVFSLRQVGQLPESMIARLRDKKEFQGVRYEIAVASMFARAGFTIAFCEPVHGQKICEFIARHPAFEPSTRHGAEVGRLPTGYGCRGNGL